MGLQKPPGFVVRFRPALSKNAAANLAVVGQFAQPFLYGDANVSAGAGRTVAVDQLEQGLSPPARGGEFAVETSQSFLYLRHLRLEVYGFDGGFTGARSRTSACWRLIIRSIAALASTANTPLVPLAATGNGFAGFLVCSPAPLRFPLVPELL